MSKLCGNCGKREMKYTNIKGPNDFSWKDFPSVRIESDLELLVCSNCDNIGLMGDETKMLDAAIIASIKQQTAYFIDSIIKRYSCEQKTIADHIGLTPERLSEVKSGRSLPSFQTFNFLKTLAFDNTAFEVSSPEFNFDYKVAMSSKLNL